MKKFTEGKRINEASLSMDEWTELQDLIFDHLSILHDSDVELVAPGEDDFKKLYLKYKGKPVTLILQESLQGRDKEGKYFPSTVPYDKD